MTEMKNAYDGLVNRLDVTEERISDLEDMSKGTSKSEMPRKKRK